MAIFGHFFDRATNTRAGDALGGVTLTTSAHSLPATNPEIIIPVLKSIQQVGAGIPVMQMFAIGGNASLATIGWASTASTVSAPVISYDVLTAVLHSIIR